MKKKQFANMNRQERNLFLASAMTALRDVVDGTGTAVALVILEIDPVEHEGGFPVNSLNIISNFSKTGDESDTIQTLADVFKTAHTNL